MQKIRPIAIYLPQFHPIPENDEWWGKGFTEWTNVTKARPLFDDHYQPHLPADLGFYDLRLPEAREAQAKLAKQYGIEGFCYYHYWFNGRRILERPFQEVYESGKPDFPFMLCWANENWSRAWDGSETKLLLKQNYNDEDDKIHIRSLIPYFKDPRYIRVDGKPVFVIYKSSELPNPKRSLEIWREEARKEGLELYVCRIERWNGAHGKESLEDGFDAAIDFQPLSSSLNELGVHKFNQIQKSWLQKAKHKFINLRNKLIRKDRYILMDLEEYVNFDLSRNTPDYKLYPGVSPMWDNTSRRKNNALIFNNSSPDLYEKWLSGKLNKFTPYSKEENFVFINAWNEWAEGNHMEPCQKWGTQFLEANLRALQQSK